MKYFTMHEMTLSATAMQRHIDNSPTPEAKRNLVQLVEVVLDPARERLGFPVVVTSGYRCPKLNRAVEGSPRSQHLKGEAADLISINNAALGVIIAQHLPFDQLIFETRTSAGYPRLRMDTRQLFRYPQPAAKSSAGASSANGRW